MTERLQYPPVYLGLFFLLLTAVTAAIWAVAPPFQATILSIACGILYAAGLYTCHRHAERYEQQSRQLLNGSALLALVLFAGGSALSGVEMGLVLLLITIQAGRNLVLSSRRDLNFACLISLVLILYASGTAKDAYFISFIILYAVAAIFTFMADLIDSRLAHAHGGDRQLLSRGMSLPVKGIGVAGLILALAFAVYLGVPRLPSPQVKAMPSKSVWNYDNRKWQAEALKPAPDGLKPENPGGSSAKSSTATLPAGSTKDSFDVTVVGTPVQGPNPVVLNLQSDRPVYARGEVFDSFDGLRWHVSPTGVGKRFNPEGRFEFGQQPISGGTLQIYTIRHELAPSILAAYRPLKLAFPGSVIETDAALTMRVPGRLSAGTVYSVVSRIDEVDQHPCSGTQPDDGPGLDRYQALYPEVSPRLTKLAAEIAKNSGDDFGRAKAIESYLRENYAYTRDTATVEWTGNPVEQFLFDLKAGHCELFASSMTLMLRSLGISARLVNGFYIQRYNPVTGYYEALASDRHAWVEAYLEPHGWVTFEPTSSFELPERTPKMFVASSLFKYIDESMLELLRQHRDSLLVKILHKLWLFLVKLKLAIFVALAVIKLTCMYLWIWFLQGGWKILLLLLAGAGAAWRFWRFYEPAWRLARLERARSADPHGFPRLCYQEMERFFALRGVVRSPHLTAVEYENVLVRRFLPLSGQIVAITRIFEQAAYGGVPLAPLQVEQLSRAVKEILRSK